MFNTTTICIDLAKIIFQIAVFNKAGKAIINKAVKQKALLKIISQYPKATICMEACGSSHYWGRRFQKEGYNVKLLPAQMVAKYRAGNKSDKNDALAIFETSKNQTIHTVPVKTLEQQDMAVLHKHREGLKKQRNQVASRIRGFGLEYGVTFSLSIKRLSKEIPLALEDAENELTAVARRILNALSEQLKEQIELFEQATKELISHAKSNDLCKLLITIPGIAWLGASMLFAKLGNARNFKKGRDASANLGIVPGHTGTGGKVTHLGITKRGDVYLRSLIINSARSVVSHINQKTDKLSHWIRNLLVKKTFNKVVVAVANKLVRIATALLKSGNKYNQTIA